jgi:hypothetical protein
MDRHPTQILDELTPRERKALLAHISGLITEEITGPHDHCEDKTPGELRESAYRRGYQQGIACAIEHLKNGGSVAQLTLWEQTVHSWRMRLGGYKRSRSAIERAPEPGFIMQGGSRKFVPNLYSLLKPGYVLMWLPGKRAYERQVQVQHNQRSADRGPQAV